ncbi:MAG: acyloxyacyl hydrolase [Halarcobacter sp.]
MKKNFIILFFLIFSIQSLNAFDKVSLSYGHKDDIDITGISLIKDIDYEILDNLNLSIELLGEYAKGKQDDMFIISAQPMASYDLTKNLYFEAGAGIAHFTKEQLDKKRFGMNFQFKESVGFGYRFSDILEATLKYNHYSNADLAGSNAGLDFVALRVIYRF